MCLVPKTFKKDFLIFFKKYRYILTNVYILDCLENIWFHVSLLLIQLDTDIGLLQREMDFIY